MSFVSADIVAPNPVNIVAEDPSVWGTILGVVLIVIIISIGVLRKIRKSGDEKLNAKVLD